MKQKKFNFHTDPQYTLDHYIISQHNQEAFEWLYNISFWKNDATVKGCMLIAEQGAGKSHLASILLSCSDDVKIYDGNIQYQRSPFDFNDRVILIDDAHHIQPIWLFNLYNHVLSYGGKLLLFSSHYPKEWNELKDLDSRIATLQYFSIDTPDDEAMLLIIKSILKRQGYHVTDRILKKIRPSINRSFKSLASIVDEIKMMLAEKNK